jgi:hypothetical protein
VARKRADSLEELVAKGMAEFGLVDEGVPYTPLSTVQSDDQAIEQPTSSPATQDVREFIKPVQAVETRTSWIIPGKTDEPSHAMETNPDPTVELSADEPESPAEPVEPLHPAPSTGQGDWDEAFTPEPEPELEPEPEVEPAKEALTPPPPRVVKPAFSGDLEIEW